MSSKKQNSETHHKPKHPGGKNAEEKKKTQKEAYKQKNYKSSPSLSTTTSGKTLFHYEASSKCDVNSHKDDSKKFVKGRNPTNIQSHNKNTQCVTNLSVSTDACEAWKVNVKLGYKGNSNVSNIVSPLFTSMSKECNPNNVMSMSRQSEQRANFHRYQDNSKQSGAKPKIYNESKPNPSSKYENKNLPDKQTKIAVPSSSLKENNIKNTSPWEKKENSHKKTFHYKNNSMIKPQDSKFKPNNFSKPLQFHVPYNDNNAKVHPTKNLTTIIKYRKKGTHSKKEKSKYGNMNQKFPSKACRKEHDFFQKTEFEAKSVVPLLTFKSNVEPEKDFDLIHFSDDDDMYSLSQNSSDTIADLIDFSDGDSIPVSQPINAASSTALLEMIQLPDYNINVQTLSDEGSDSSETSDESDLTSEFSESSVLDSETKMNFLNPTIEESFVAVFWDIENCPLPSCKSAVDFVSYVRSTFYEGRSEVSFTAACDVSNLNSSLVRELDEASVTLVHISSLNKNAADKKIMALLQRYQIQYRKSNSAIVLISSDSDFSQILVDMRYQHHIFINLICKLDTRSSLTTAANYYVYFDNILAQLPDRDANSNIQHVLVVTNLPQIKFKEIKSCLGEKLKSYNCRIKYQSQSMLKIIFKDHSVCINAKASLENFYLKGNKLDISYQKEMTEIESILPKKEKNDKLKKSVVKNVEKIDSSGGLVAKSEVTKENINRNVTVCVYVSHSIGDVEYWKNEFENLLKTNNFSIVWDKTFDGCFLISFKSHKEAQKAKKILLKNQVTNPLAPKFLKLIKHEENLSNLSNNIVSDVQEQMKRKIDEHLQIIERKKLKFLKEHEKNMNEIMHQAASGISGSAEVAKEKLKECKEQMETFIDFYNIIINTIRLLNCDSKDLDTKLMDLLTDFTRECNCIASALPIYAKKREIFKKLREHQVIVIRAETGSGKSTQLTQYIWRDRKNFQNGKIICTQPRKIAAISLAKHVSSQIGSNLGGIVGYRVGMVNKMSADTNILYVTDFTMLKILISESLDNVSCIIVDEAHERTIYTDILLGMIKEYLPRYPHLNVIITSATIDTSIFRDYFSLTDDAVLCIPGRIFPVEDIWLNTDVTPDGDYMNKTIDKAFTILTEEPGDVLCFLVTPFDTEKAVENFSKKLAVTKDEKKVKLYCLHGKMSSEDQQKVFEKTPKGIRKVIFATNCAETSITIPGIKYVIDCGLVKESQYDSVRNMNILSVGFVSKSSAEQRRGRAGRTQIGKCYRLYSKNNYNSMTNNTSPEILRINLGQALLKLLKFGVKNPVQFDFIQSPSKERLFAAMDQLLFLNAVDENFVMTDLGSNMAALPLEPRLSHLVFQGFENDIGYDTLVIAALITMSHAIFFRNSENKEEADKRKRRFCESESDFISYLAVYKEWVEVPKNSKSQWCVINCINAKSMRTVHDLINEIILILQKELNFNVKLKSNCESNYDTLLRLIFLSFSQNLSVFSGHVRCGYKCLNVSDQLLIHPSSSLSTFGQSTPEFVVYDTVLKTTQTFIINVSPVSRDMIVDAIYKYNLKIDLDSLESLCGIEHCISPVGEKIIFSCFIGKKNIKRKELQREIKKLTSSDIVEIDIDVSKGCIKIFGFNFDVDIIKSFASSILQDAQQHLLDEKKDVYLLDNDRLPGILSAGGLITDIILPGEFRDLKVLLKNEGIIDPVLEKLSLCGTITEVREWKRYFKVTFETPGSAKLALDTYRNETEFSLTQVHKYSAVNEWAYLYKVFMSYLRRPCTGVAYITVEPRVSSALLSSLLYDGNGARMSLCKKSGDIRIVGLPEHTDKKKLESMVSEVLPSDVKITKCLVVRKKPYESTTEEMESIKKKIAELFSEFTFKESISVFLKKPPPKEFYWNATVYFKNSFDGETAVNVLKSRKILSHHFGGIVLKPELQTYLCCKLQIFNVVKEEIEDALQFFKTNRLPGNLLDINAVPKGLDIVQIKIMGNNVRDVTDARRCIHKILSGDELKFDSTNKSKLFSYSGKEWIKKLSLEFENCFILQNYSSKTLTLFGKETFCNLIKMRINGYLCSLEKNDFKELNLKTNSGKNGVLKALLKEYGYDLQKLKEDCKASDIEINKYKQLLIIQGPASSVSKCETIIENIKQTLEANCFEVRGETCPVCYDEVTEEKHRLECCGHAYCTECLLHLLQNSENIPLKCEDEDCDKFIVLTDIFWAINGRKSLERVLFNKFLHTFVETRDDIRFCPSPNCPMVFRISEDKMEVYNCIACGNDICTKCGDLYHGGISCSFHKCATSDVSLQIWLKEDQLNHKLCPSCSSPIEKNGGCNHMTCWKCKCHMCWLCLSVFPTGVEVYNHQIICPMNNPLMHPLM